MGGILCGDCVLVVIVLDFALLGTNPPTPPTPPTPTPPTPTPSDFVQPSPWHGTTLKVMSANLEWWRASQHGMRGIQASADIHARARPHLIGYQECDDVDLVGGTM